MICQTSEHDKTNIMLTGYGLKTYFDTAEAFTDSQVTKNTKVQKHTWS
jgi:hypothetical protein